MIPDSEFGDVDFNYPSQPNSIGELLLAPEGSELRIEMLRVLMGPQGEKGDRGDQGERGIQGDRGDLGERGEKGDPGERGLQGERGEKGDRGDQGERGVQGDRGDQGERGEKGDPGERGISVLFPGERRIIPAMETEFEGWIEASPIAPTIVSTLIYPRLIGRYPQTAPELKLDMQALIDSGEVVITDSGHYGSRDGKRLFDGSLAQHAGDGQNLPGEYHTLGNWGEDWIRMQFSASVKIIAVKYTQRDWPESFLNNIRLRYTNDDGISWNDLKSSVLTTAAAASDLVDYTDVAVDASDYSFAFNHNGYAALGEAEIWIAGAAVENSVAIPAIPVGAGFKVIIWGGNDE